MQTATLLPCVVCGAPACNGRTNVKTGNPVFTGGQLWATVEVLGVSWFCAEHTPSSDEPQGTATQGKGTPCGSKA